MLWRAPFLLAPHWLCEHSRPRSSCLRLLRPGLPSVHRPLLVAQSHSSERSPGFSALPARLVPSPGNSCATSSTDFRQKPPLITLRSGRLLDRVRASESAWPPSGDARSLSRVSRVPPPVLLR